MNGKACSVDIKGGGPRRQLSLH